MFSLVNYSPKNLRTILRNKFLPSHFERSQTVWERISARLMRALGTSRYGDFASVSEFVSFDDDTLVIACRDHDSLVRLRACCFAALIEAVREVTNRNAKVVFKVIEGRYALRQPDRPAHDSGAGATFKEFIVGDCNRVAFKAVSHFADCGGNNRYKKLLLCASPGNGKTHLLSALRARISSEHPKLAMIFADCGEFATQFAYAVQNGRVQAFKEKYRLAGFLLMDNVHLLSHKPAAQEEFLQMFNDIDRRGGCMVMTSSVMPKGMADMNKKLASRLASCAAFAIETPDESTRRRVVDLLSAKERLGLPEGARAAIAGRNVESIRETIESARLTAKHGRDGEAFEGFQKNAGKKHVPSLEDICLAVAVATGVPARDIVSRSRTKTVAMARHICVYVAKKHTGKAWHEIGRFYGGRDHATAASAFAKIEKSIGSEADLRKKVMAVERSLEGVHKK